MSVGKRKEVTKLSKKCVIFGAGERGLYAFSKLSLFFEVVAYADNNTNLWGESLNGIVIIPPGNLPRLVDETGALIFIANKEHTLDIAKQLDSLEINDYYKFERNLCYELERGVWYPVSFGNQAAFKKPDKDKTAVLFVQEKPCTRTNKIARVLKDRGVLTYSAYIASPSDAGKDSFMDEFLFWTYDELLDFVNESEFDIVHCSNEPDALVNLLLYSNKKVVHDCHDIVTLSKKSYHPAELMLEYIANTQANAVIYTTERMREVLRRKYSSNCKHELVLGNYPLSSCGRIKRLPKLSEKDGNLHCVYEGHIVDALFAESLPYRFVEPVFMRLAQLGVHVHIFSQCVPQYLRQLDSDYANLHYEGNYSGQELITQMSRYDLGLLVFPPVDTTYLELSSPNKMTEYLDAGLPVITNVKEYGDILVSNGCGGMVDLENDDAFSRMKQYSEITIDKGFCDDHGFTMDSNADRILQFYKKVLNH